MCHLSSQSIYVTYSKGKENTLFIRDEPVYPYLLLKRPVFYLDQHYDLYYESHKYRVQDDLVFKKHNGELLGKLYDPETFQAMTKLKSNVVTEEQREEYESLFVFPDNIKEACARFIGMLMEGIALHDKGEMTQKRVDELVDQVKAFVSSTADLKKMICVLYFFDGKDLQGPIWSIQCALREIIRDGRTSTDYDILLYILDYWKDYLLTLPNSEESKRFPIHDQLTLLSKALIHWEDLMTLLPLRKEEALHPKLFHPWGDNPLYFFQDVLSYGTWREQEMILPDCPHLAFPSFLIGGKVFFPAIHIEEALIKALPRDLFWRTYILGGDIEDFLLTSPSPFHLHFLSYIVWMERSSNIKFRSEAFAPYSLFIRKSVWYQHIHPEDWLTSPYVQASLRLDKGGEELHRVMKRYGPMTLFHTSSPALMQTFLPGSFI